MNISEMSNLLALRLEDAAGVTFTQSKRLKLLNNAQLTLAQLIHSSYLTELEVLEEGLTATAGVYALSSLQNDVLRGGEGIIKVKINGTGGKYCTEIDMKSIKRTENTFLAGGINNPLYYIFQNNIYVSNGETNPVIDILYLKIPSVLLHAFTVDSVDIGSPTTMFTILAGDNPSAVNDYYNNAVIYALGTDKLSYHVITDYIGATKTITVSPAAAGIFTTGETFYFLTHDFDLTELDQVTCNLNESLHELTVTLAEAEGWGMDMQFARRQAALNSALDEVKTLNERYEKAEGIGIQNR